MSDLDCVVVGYNDIVFGELMGAAERLKDVSASYRHYKVNTLEFKGQQLRYHDVLNACRSEATGRPSRFHVGNMPNLGACYLVSFLRRHGVRSEIVNFFNDDKERLRDLLASRPRAVAITTTFYFDHRPIREIVDFVRMYSEGTKVIVGGPHIFNLCTDHLPAGQDSHFKRMAADIYIFDSQGELTLSRVCEALRDGTPLSAIPNVIHTTDGKTFHRSSRVVENNDMDENTVDWSSFPPDFLAPTVQTRTARSCAFKCAFCRYPVIGGDLNVVSVERVEQELKYLHSIGVTHLLFIDDTFNIPKPRFKELCRMMIRNRFNFKWFSYFRCANADDEAFELLAESGCTGVFLGIESGDERILKAMNKGAALKQYRYGIGRLNELGIMSYASFIVGYPGETVESARNTIAFINETQPTFYCLETYFHDTKVPIAAQTTFYGIDGSGYSWRHNSMDWRQACDFVDEGYVSIKGPIVVPLYSFDLWSIAYLMGQGVSRERMTEFLRLAGSLLVEQVGGHVGDPHDYSRRMVDVFRSGSARPREVVHA